MAKFLEVFEDVTKYGTKIPTDKYLASGEYPIIDQGQTYISGYINDGTGLFTDVPAIIFGDHTRVLKYVDTPCFLGADGVKLLKTKDNSSDYKYLYYALCNANIPNTGYNRHFKWLKEVNIPLPNVETQHQIANTLDKVTHTIDICNAILEKLDLLVKSRFIEMFGDPVINPMGWEKYALGTCLESIDNGKSYVCENDCRIDERPAILKLSAVTYGIYKPDENKAMIDEKLFEKSVEVNDFDLLFTRKNTPEFVGMSAYVFSTPRNLMLPDLIFRLNTKATCNKIYLWQLINHDLFRPCIQNIANGSAKSMSNISKERLSHLTIPLPPLTLQQQFAAFVEATDKSKFEVQQIKEKAETLKKALMQEYFG